MSDLKALTTYFNARKERFADVLGSQNAGPYIASVLLAVVNDPTGKLQNCDVSSIYHAALQAATLRLSVDPSTGQAHLVPFGNRATLIVGYKGLYDMAVRTTKYRYINVVPRYEGQTTEAHPITGLITIESLGGEKKSDKVIGWLGAFEMNPERGQLTGYAKTIYMTAEEIEAHARKYSKLYQSDLKNKKQNSQWSLPDGRETMEKKTVLRVLLRKWGYLDPVDAAALEAVEADQPIDIEPSPIPDDLDEAERQTVEEVKRTEQENLEQLGFE